MNIQAIVQIAEQTKINNIDGIFTLARCTKNLYNKVNVKGNRGKFEKAAARHLHMTTAATFIWLKINKNEQILIKYKNHLPINIHSLDVIASMTEEEIIRGINEKIITKDANVIKDLRLFQHTLNSYKDRNSRIIERRKRIELQKQEDKNNQKEIKEQFDKSANKDKEPLYNNKGLTKEIDKLNKKYEDIMNKFHNINKQYEEMNNRIDLIQKLIMKM